MTTPYNLVDTGAMRQAVQSFEVTERKLAAIRANVSGQLGSLTAGWTGEVAQQYQRVMVTWVSQYERIVKDLQNMVLVLNENIAAYERGQAANSETVASLNRTAAGPTSI
ncbi:WXG100 family type VII secretion target [Streptomyces mirabilis]|uniref:WXG100 family type VII secretion target n=1 Tax=Streptomyces mirabilis TaxID=68239 RepID=UPI0036C7DAC8